MRPYNHQWNLRDADFKRCNAYNSNLYIFIWVNATNNFKKIVTIICVW